MLKAIEKTYTKEDLVKIFKDLGVTKGMILEVHSSLKGFGYIIGGAQSYVDALLEAVDYNGTIVMPLQYADNNDPCEFKYPPIAHELHDMYREHMPGFDPKKSEITYMGKAVENLRRREKSEFSKHPNCAFVAYGRYAKLITSNQNLDFALDDDSPLGKLYELKAQCLLVGCGYDSMTSLHLAEYRSKVRGIKKQAAAIDDGIRSWIPYLDIDLDSDDGFDDIGKRLEEKGQVKKTMINDMPIRLLSIENAVLEGVRYYMERMMRYRL